MTEANADPKDPHVDNDTSTTGEAAIRRTTFEANDAAEGRRSSDDMPDTGSWLQRHSQLILVLIFCIVLAFANPGAVAIGAIGTAAALIIRALHNQ